MIRTDTQDFEVVITALKDFEHHKSYKKDDVIELSDFRNQDTNEIYIDELTALESRGFISIIKAPPIEYK